MCHWLNWIMAIFIPKWIIRLMYIHENYCVIIRYTNHNKIQSRYTICQYDLLVLINSLLITIICINKPSANITTHNKLDGKVVHGTTSKPRWTYLNKTFLLMVYRMPNNIKLFWYMLFINTINKLKTLFDIYIYGSKLALLMIKKL